VDCVNSSDLDCVDRLCFGEHCDCAIRKCNNPQKRCNAVGGKCMYKEECANNPMFYCRDYCTDNDECNCAIRKDCKQTTDCRRNGGTCKMKCVEDKYYECIPNICGIDGCKCMARRKFPQLV